MSTFSVRLVRPDTLPAPVTKASTLYMYSDPEKIIVQCKRHGNLIGPAVVRELYGALAASNAQSAVLVCTAGFT